MGEAEVKFSGISDGCPFFNFQNKKAMFNLNMAVPGSELTGSAGTTPASWVNLQTGFDYKTSLIHIHLNRRCCLHETFIY
jgi:hypothetical protein